MSISKNANTCITSLMTFNVYPASNKNHISMNAVGNIITGTKKVKNRYLATLSPLRHNK